MCFLILIYRDVILEAERQCAPWVLTPALSRESPESARITLEQPLEAASIVYVSVQEKTELRGKRQLASHCIYIIVDASP